MPVSNTVIKTYDRHPWYFRNCFCLKISVPVTPHGMYFPSTSLIFHRCPTSCREGHGGMVLNRMYGEGESQGRNRLTQVRLQGRSLCVFVIASLATASIRYIAHHYGNRATTLALCANNAC